MLTSLPKFLKNLLAIAVLAAVQTCAQAQISVYDVRIVNTYPHNISAFTQGLLIHDGYLYEGTGRLGQSSLSKIDLESGEVLQNKRLGSRYFGEGIAIVGNRIFQLTWQSNLVFVHDLETFNDVTTHYHPTEGWGLTYDGTHLILSDGTARLQFIDPETFQQVRTLDVSLQGRPIANLNELEYIDGEIWANVWMTNEIVRINENTGHVQSVIDLSSLKGITRTGGNDDVLNGIAWDSENKRLFVTGKLWANLFEIELVRRN